MDYVVIVNYASTDKTGWIVRKFQQLDTPILLIEHEVNTMVGAPLYEGTGKLMVIAPFAAEKGKFWSMNDVLFNITARGREIDLQELARYVGIKTNDLTAALPSASICAKPPERYLQRVGVKNPWNTRLHRRCHGIPGKASP